MVPVSQSLSVVRLRYAIAAGLLILGFAVWINQAPSVLAQADSDSPPPAYDPTSCGHFDSQADAQHALVSGEVSEPENLDPDGDGIACEERWPLDPDSPPPAYDPTSCGHFESQEDAQAAFDAGEVSEPENLDADGDGVVCEFAFGDDRDTEGNPVALPSTGIGSTAERSGSTLGMFLLGCAIASAAYLGVSVRNGMTMRQ